jgi:RND superfamily putative drug exporter
MRGEKIQHFMMRLSSNLRRFRWLVFTGWLLALAPAVYLVATQSGQLTGGGFEVFQSQSLYVHDELKHHYPEHGASPLALVAAPRADATYDDMNTAVTLLHGLPGEIPGLSVRPNPAQRPPQPDRPYVVSLLLDSNNASAVDVAKRLRARLGIVDERPGHIENGTVRLYVIGQGALGAAASAKTKQDIASAEQWNLPIVLIVLLAVFGSLAAAAIPLALGIGTVVITMGSVYVLSMFTTMSVFVTSTVSMFGIALAIDYSLFILMRYREELAAGRQPQQAIDAAMATSGLAVLLSGLTVVASVTGIYLIRTPVLVSMATGAILAVSVAVLTSVTMTPAVLTTFGRAAARRSAVLRWSRRPASARSRFWTRWVVAVMHRPWLSTLGASALLLAVAAPAVSLTLGNSTLHQFDSAHEIRGGVAAAAEALGPGALAPIQVLITFPDGGASSAEHAGTLAAIRHEMALAPTLKWVPPPVFADNNGSALMSAVLSVDPEDNAARETIDRLRAQLPDAAGESAQVTIGGPTALIKDFDDRVSTTEPLVLAFVAAIAFVMLLISIRSVLLAFKGVLMTMLSVATAYGSLVMVFEWGWLQGLGVAPIGSIDSTIPPMVLAMTFGLSMDYEIFLLTRIRERFLQFGDTRDAVAYGVSTSARTITSAALIMIAVFIGFAFAGMPLVAEMGVACAVAIAVDATVVRLVLVPALMAICHEWNWWLPGWLGHILPSVDFEKPLPMADVDAVVTIADDACLPSAPSADIEAMTESAKKFKKLTPDAVFVADPLALHGCATSDSAENTALAPVIAGNGDSPAAPDGERSRHNGAAPAAVATPRPHPVTLWCGRLSVALDALQHDSGPDDAALQRRGPLETTNVELATGDRYRIPTGAETLRLQGYLIMRRNNRGDYARFADLAEVMSPETAAVALAGIDNYYCGQPAEQHWIVTRLVARLADPQPCDLDGSDGGAEADEPSQPDAPPDWGQVRGRCLAVAVAMLEKAR